MILEPSGDWSGFKQIFADHWDGFKQVNPRYNTHYYETLVEKMLNCGNPDKMGYIDYRCPHCGQGQHRLAMTCKSSLCLRCAKVYVDDWVSQVSRMLHEGLIYRHIVLTMPEILRPTFYRHSKDLLSPLMRCGVKCLDDVLSRLSHRPLQGGYIVVVQTHGRSGQYNPPVHIIAPRGGGDQQAEWWVHLD